MAKENIPKTCRIGNNCFTAVAVSGGKILSNSRKNHNHVHKYEGDMLLVIIKIGTNVSDGDKILYDGNRLYNWVLKSHVSKHLHGYCVFGLFAKLFHEGSI